MSKLKWANLLLLPLILVVIRLQSGMNPQALGQIDSSTSTPTPIEASVTDDDTWVSAVRELMITNNECSLPCFWGFEPGETSIDNIRDFISGIESSTAIMSELNEPPAEGRDGELVYNFSLLFGEEGLILVEFFTHDDYLIRTFVSITQPSEFVTDSVVELPMIIETLGEPTDIFIALRGPSPSNYYLTLVYNNDGVMIRYTISPQEPFYQAEADEPLELCPSMIATERISLWLQSTEDEILVEENLPGLRNDTSPRSSWSLERITDGMDIKSFTRLFTDDPDACIQLLSINQLREQGYSF